MRKYISNGLSLLLKVKHEKITQTITEQIDGR